MSHKAYILKNNKKTVIVAVPHKFKSGDGSVNSSIAEIKINKEWLASTGMTAEDAAADHVATKIINFAGF